MDLFELALDVFRNTDALRPDPFRGVTLDARLLYMEIFLLGLNSEPEAPILMCCRLSSFQVQIVYHTPTQIMDLDVYGCCE